MSRLVCLDYSIGRKVNIRGVPHRVVRAVAGATTLLLAPDAPSEKKLQISRNELACLLVLEEAELVDDLDDPEPKHMRPITDLSHMSVHRVMEWQAKLFMFRNLIPVVGRSPRGKAFLASFRAVELELEAWREAMGVGGGKRWSAWNCYHDLIRWRRNRYALGAIQRKGVEYCPWSERNGFYEKVREMAIDIASKQPHLSAAQVQRETAKRRASETSRGNEAVV